MPGSSLKNISKEQSHVPVRLEVPMLNTPQGHGDAGTTAPITQVLTQPHALHLETGLRLERESSV